MNPPNLSSEDEQWPLEVDSLQKSYYSISGLGCGSFGFAILAKSKKSLDHFLAVNSQKKGTMMEPLTQPYTSNLYTNGLVAIKVMKTQFKRSTDYLQVNEVNFILSVRLHQNLLQIFSIFVDKYNGRLNIVMEPMDQNLYQFIQKNQGRDMACSVIKSMLAQLLNAIRHIHRLGFFHRDVKPENILVSLTSRYYGEKLMIPPDKRQDMYIVKLCDYGLARHISNVRELTPYVSTRWYRAPEILLRLQKYLFPIDIWAFGCVAVELVNKYPLFSGKNESEQLWEITQVLGHPLNRTCDDIGGEWTEGILLAEELGFCMPLSLGTSIYDILGHDQYKGLADMIKQCFMWDPKLRPTSNELAKSGYFHNSILSEHPEPPLQSLPSKLFDDYNFRSNYTWEPRSDDSNMLAYPHNNHYIQDVFSDPLVSVKSDDGILNRLSSNLGETLDQSPTGECILLGDDQSGSFWENQSTEVCVSDFYRYSPIPESGGGISF